MLISLDHVLYSINYGTVEPLIKDPPGKGHCY